mmetsp:Transcript_6379/g.13370  ORF Transcript_6379/g.13370 Transcript_6379/m.13370 type:complete len:626 (+) Transcript_6379:145-2022(+)
MTLPACRRYRYQHQPCTLLSILFLLASVLSAAGGSSSVSTSTSASTTTSGGITASIRSGILKRRRSSITDSVGSRSSLKSDTSDSGDTPDKPSLFSPVFRQAGKIATDMIDAITKPKRLGDVWSESSAYSSADTTAKEAFAAGHIKSIDLPLSSDSDDDGGNGSAKVRVCFRNLTSDPITLCWMSYKCEPHHFYRLEPQRGVDDKHRHVQVVDSVVSMDNRGHIETTSLGHAFLFARRTANHEKGDDEETTGRSIASDDESISVSDHDDHSIDSVDLTPPPAKRRLGGCWTLCLPKHDNGDKTNLRVATSTDGRSVLCDEVIGAYRPTTLSLQRDNDIDSEHRIQVVTIAKQRSRGFLRGGSCHYIVQVTEGSLDKTPIDTSDKIYRNSELGGWPVRCEEGLWSNSDHADTTFSPEQLKEEAKLKDIIAGDLAAAVRCLPPAARAALRSSTPIYINRSQKYGPKCAPITARDMCFHPDKSWLIENGMSEKKAGCVEMYQISSYPRDRHCWGEGGALLHELSHAYHHKCLEEGFDNAEVLACYKRAMKKGLYEKVCVHGLHGPEECRAYACTNEMEYFAELSAAFLGGLDGGKEFNKWFPHNREQIKEHDPDAYEMLKRAWGVPVD